MRNSSRLADTRLARSSLSYISIAYITTTEDSLLPTYTAT